MELALKCEKCGLIHAGIIAEECIECGSSLDLTRLDSSQRVRKISEIKQILSETEWLFFEKYAYMHHLTPRELLRKCIKMYVPIEEMMQENRLSENKDMKVVKN